MNFLPMPDDKVKADIIYLCSPNNPTGASYNKEQLKAWVDYALKNDSVILYDSAYEAFITDQDLPRSIYAIEGAKECAIEFCSLSKTAGFTGTRFSYTVVPTELVFTASNGATLSLHDMWNRRQSTKFTVRHISFSRRQQGSSQKRAWQSASRILNTIERMHV